MSFIWNGVSSDTMKFNVTSRQVYNAPAYDLNAIEVPGRSGDLLNPQNRFKNKQISYTGFLKASDFEGSTWREKLSAGLIQLKGWLCSDAGQYHELTDDYDPGFSRYGYISGETAISDVQDRPFGVTLTVTFNCKPYMYMAGEPMELPETKSASGDIITITDGAENTPLKSAVVNIEPVQSGSGDPSPTNIRPISGWTQVNVVAAGGNLLPNKFYQDGANTVVLGQERSANVGQDVFLKAGTYHIDVVSTKTVSLFYKRSGEDTVRITTSSLSASFTLTKDGYYAFWAYVGSGLTTADISSAQVSYSSTALPYQEYTATPITIPLGQTVYGGTLDVVAGEGESVLGNATYDGTDSSGWTRTAAYGSVTRFDKSISGLKPASGNNLKCNQLKVGTIGTANLACCNVHGNSPVLQIQIPTSLLASDNVAGLMTYFQSHPLQVCYELATPLEYDVSPQTIKTLLGTNNIWADAGSMEIEYPIPTENPYPFGSRPLYEITMAGTGTLVVNGKEWTVTDYTGTLYCDTEAMEWYDASQLRNNIVSGDGWPVFEAGENSISYTGDITKVMVTPRWRTL